MGQIVIQPETSIDRREGWQWGRCKDRVFLACSSRRRYLCEHNRRSDACRKCGGIRLAVRWMHYSARTRAKRDSVPFTISQEEILALIGNGVCPVLDTPYEFSAVKRKGGTDNSPSLDRFYPERGYVTGNCFVISSLANRIKNSATTAQVLQVAAWMKQTEAGYGR